MRIAVLSDYSLYHFLPDVYKNRAVPHPGLPQNLVAKHLSRFWRDEVYLLTMSGDYDRDYTFIEDGVTYIFLKTSGKIVKYVSLLQSNAWRIHSCLERINPDIIYGIGLNRFSYFGLTSVFPTVVCNAGFTRDYYLHGKEKFNIHWATAFLYEKLVTGKMEFVQSVSPYVTKDTMKYPNVKRHWEIEPPISEIYFEPQELKWEAFVLYVGSISERKNLLDLVKAIKPLDSLRLKVISMTNCGDYFDKVLDYVNSNGMSERVELLGYQDPKGIIEELRRCTAFVMPSRWESNGMVYAEAMAIGKPVIGTNVAAIPFTIRNGITGFLTQPGSLDDLSEKISLLRRDHKLAEDLGANGKQEALERWHPEKIAAKVRNMFEKVLEISKGTRSEKV